MTNLVGISVVIPTFNRAGLVSNAINSVLRQTHPAAEIIVVNDGSSDSTAEVLKTFGDRICVIHQSNSGLSGARNAGILAATSPWIAFLDDDDEYTPDRLEIAVESIERCPAAGVHATNSALVSSDGSVTEMFALRGYSATHHMLLARPLEWIFRGCFFAQSWVVKRADLLAVGLFRKTFYEDMDIAVRLAAHTTWIADSRASLRVIRRANESNLSGQWRSRPVENFQALVKIYRDALAQPSLTRGEQDLVKTGLSTYLFELGCTHLLLDQKREGNACLREAATVFPRFHSRLKARSTLIGGKPAARLFQQRRERKTKVRA